MNTIDQYQQDGSLIWTSLHRACRLNELDHARQLLDMGADPNLEVRTLEEPAGDGHGYYDEWFQAQAYRGKTCLELARCIWEDDDGRFDEMRTLLKQYGAR